MTIFSFADLHLDFYIANNRPKQIIKFHQQVLGSIEGNVLIIAGDISHYNALTYAFLKHMSQYFDRIFIVTGNHDFYNVSKSQKYEYPFLFSKVEELRQLLMSLPKVHLLEGQTVNFNGVTFGGAMGWYDCSYFYKLSTIYSQSMLSHWSNYTNDARLIPKLDNPLDLFAIELPKIDSALAQSPDIMISHFCPIIEDIAIAPKYRTDRGTGYYYFDYAHKLEALTTKPKMWIHGHTHNYSDFMFNDINFYRNPLGYPSEHNSINLNPIIIGE